jgi:hypothetical protein
MRLLYDRNLSAVFPMLFFYVRLLFGEVDQAALTLYQAKTFNVFMTLLTTRIWLRYIVILTWLFRIVSDAFTSRIRRSISSFSTIVTDDLWRSSVVLSRRLRIVFCECREARIKKIPSMKSPSVYLTWKFCRDPLNCEVTVSTGLEPRAACDLFISPNDMLIEVVGIISQFSYSK